MFKNLIHILLNEYEYRRDKNIIYELYLNLINIFILNNFFLNLYIWLKKYYFIIFFLTKNYI